MKAVRFDSFGEPISVLHLAGVERPEPKPGSIRVRVSLAPIHNHDTLIIKGQYGYKPPLPAPAGTEAMGVVDAIGDGVTNVTIGQRVAFGGMGTWAEYATADARGVLPLPDEISDEIGAQLLSMPMSALRLLEDLDVKPGEWIIQNAANGAVGKTLARIAAKRGIKVVNLVRRDSAVGELEQAGISNVVSTEQAGWQDRVKGIVGDGKITRGVDSVGGKAAGELTSLLAYEGQLFVFGALSGEALSVPISDVLFDQVTVRGFWAGRPNGAPSPEERQRLVGELLQLAHDGTLQLPVERVFTFAEAGEAAELSDQQGRTGKVLLRP